VLGFTAVFVAMGALAGTLGSFLTRYKTWVDLVCGSIVVLFGLSYLGVFQLKLFRGSGYSVKNGELGFFAAVMFGVVFSVGWTPCVGAFLGSALMLASQQGSALQGVVMLLCYSVGLGVPFLISAVLIDQLKGAFNWVKAHYEIINKVCGGALVLVGIAMATGTLGRLLAFLN
jgi:cytochrome c-type biogenesis protein